MAQRLLRPLAALFLACLAPGWSHAAELGEPRVSSFIGQQLVADIELTSVDDPAGTVGVKLASADVYRGASIAMPPVLASLNMTVMRRDGRQFLHLTSLRPVDADHLHVFLELADGGKRSVRLATLWLAADPNPAPVPAPVAAPVAAGTAASIAAVLPKAGAKAAPPAGKRMQGASPPVEKRLQAISPPAGKSMQAVSHAPAPIEQARPTKPQRPAALSAPAAMQTEPAKPRPPAVSPAPVAPSASTPPPRAKQPSAAPAVHRTAEAPATLPIHVPAPAAACAQQPAPASPSVCLALDGKNAALRAEIGHLEDQVKALQAALQVPHAAAPKPSSVAPRKRAPKKPPEEQVPSWVWIAGAAAVLAGGAAAFAVRRRRAGKGKGKGKKPRKSNKPEMEIVVTPRVMGDVRSRLMTEGPPSRMPAEPKL